MKTHKKILELKKLFKSYGHEIKSTRNNSITIHLITYSYNSIDNYLTIWNLDRLNPIGILNNRVKTIQLYFESIEQITKKLTSYGILPVQTISAARRPIQASINEVAQSKQSDTDQKNYKLLG